MWVHSTDDTIVNELCSAVNRFPDGIKDAAALEKEINNIPGVVENGKEAAAISFKVFLSLNCYMTPTTGHCWGSLKPESSGFQLQPVHFKAQGVIVLVFSKMVVRASTSLLEPAVEQVVAMFG